MKKAAVSAFILFFVCGFCFSADAAVKSCLNKCEKLNGEAFKKCMARCGVKPPEQAPQNIPSYNPARTGGCPSGMVLIPAGEFLMGASEDMVALGLEECGDTCDKNWFSGMGPQRNVRLNAFCLDETEVTQAEYKKLTGDNPSSNKECGGDCPVESVNWTGAAGYCRSLGKRLPTEAEWEYAAGAGASTKYFWGGEIDGGYLWYDGNSEESIHPVGTKKGNPFGLYDISGNVWEWVRDCYDPERYSRMPEDNPVNEESGCGSHVLRGGSWRSSALWSLWTAYRVEQREEDASDTDGFRCAADAR